MNKTIFKKMLCIINYTHHDVSFEHLMSYVQKQLHEDHIDVSYQELEKAFLYINEKEILYHDQTGYDLIPCACVFAKADDRSICEALAFLECFLKDAKLSENIFNLCTERKPIQKLADPYTWSILLQTSLFHMKADSYLINPILISDIIMIIQEYKKKDMVISSTLSAIYANEMIQHEDCSIKYRNESKKIVLYDQFEHILQIIPRMGIPENRDITKPIQNFYKDTLLYDFQHACPICGIDIPQLLIASHIKPFRDCAHVYEALDYHNGILLCKNHDFLFDQGYISFDDVGNILICGELRNKKQLYSALQIDEKKSIHHHLDKTRSLFLQYHRDSIYKK